MRTNTIVIIIIILLVGVLSVFLIFSPDQARGVLEDLGVIEPDLGYIAVSGFLEADKVTISASMSGEISEINVKIDEKVDQGVILLTLDDEYLQLLRELESVRLEIAEAELEYLQTGVRNVDIDLAESYVRLAGTALEGAKQQRIDIVELDNDYPGKDDQIKLVDSLIKQSESDLEIAKSEVDSLIQLPNKHDLESAQKLVESTNTKVAQVEIQISSTKLIAPISGTVIDIFYKPGELVMEGMPVITIAQPDMLYLITYVPEEYLSSVEIGKLVKIRIPALPDRNFTGGIVKISDQAEFTPRSIQSPEERTILVYMIEIAIPNPNDILKPGMFAEAEIEVD